MKLIICLSTLICYSLVLQAQKQNDDYDAFEKLTNEVKRHRKNKLICSAISPSVVEYFERM